MPKCNEIAAPLAGIFLSCAALAGAQTGAPAGEWPTYGGDLGHTRYAPLDQITADNFADLEIAWRFRTDNLGPVPEFRFQSTPLVVDGVLYSTAGSRRAVVALDAATGELLWVHRLDEGARGAAAPRQLSGRGLAYWDGGEGGEPPRVVYVTPGYRLVALDAATGRRVPAFGQDGMVDLKRDNDQPIDPVTGEVGLHATPIVAGDVVIVGAAHRTGGNPRSRANVKGYVRGYDVRTGERLWIFHTIPRPGQFGRDTWLADSAVYTGNTGVWGQISVDVELGLVYLPVEAATGDYFGANRPGDNLFAESLVAVDLYTGERRWHYQLVHHGIWDHDIPCAPILLDVVIDGETIKAVAQPTKQVFLYVFDRETGEPIWPIEEQPVPAGDVPGEWYSPTQPIPTRPPAYDRQGVTLDDLIDFTPELRAEAVERASFYKLGPIFTPPVVSRAGRAARHPDGAGAGGRHQLAGRVLRPGDRRPLRVVEQLAGVAGHRAPVSGAVRHGLHPGQRGDRPPHQRRRGVGGRRGPHQLHGASAAAPDGGAAAARPAHHPGAADAEAALRHHQRHRHDAGRDPVADSRTARRPTTSATTRRCGGSTSPAPASRALSAPW